MGLSRIITLTYPEALLLGALLVYLYYRFVPTKNLWRNLMVVIAILLLCYPSILHTTRSLDVFLLVDRSRSVADEARARQQEVIELATRNLMPGDRLGIVSFNEKAYIEQAPSSQAAVKEFTIPYSEDASDLAEGLQTVLSLTDDKRLARILLLSDGEYTGADPARDAQLARQKNIPIFYRDLRRAEFFNLSVNDIITPQKLLANEPFKVMFMVQSSTSTPGRYRVLRDRKIIGQQENGGWREFQFSGGENRISFTDSLKNPGIHSYSLEVETVPREQEKLVSDNVAEKYISVVGEMPLLIVNNTGAPDNVTQVLSAGGIQSHILDIDNFRMDITRLAGYKGIILNNVSILRLTMQQIEDLRRFVLEEGGGLLVCGGNNSYGMGGYYKTALEPILPVSLEDRKQTKKVATAFTFVLDRSGSMQMKTPSGRTKMELANAAAVECLGLLTPMDSLSVIAVDSLAHIMVEQQNIDNPEKIASDIRRIESMGGGIFVYTGLLAAGHEIVKAPQVNKHVLLFSDAADSEEPGHYEDLLRRFTESGITVSVVGLGTEQDPDAAFLKDIAARGKGQVYFTQDATQLIQFFTADTLTFSRNSFIETEVPIKVRAAAYSISPDQRWKDYLGSYYNLLFSKPNADIALQTADEDNAPILAFWQQGLGRVSALALDPERTFASNPDYGNVMLSAARWIMGSNVFDNFQIKTETEGTHAEVRMEVSEEEREKMGDAKLMIFTPGGETITRPMQWDSHNRMSAGMKMTEPGCYRGVVQIGDKTFKTGPMSMPVSPEFMYDKGPEAGARTLADLARISGGREVLDVRNMFDRAERGLVKSPVITPFLVAFIVLLLLDIAESRFAMLPWIRQRLEKNKTVRKVMAIPARVKSRQSSPTTTSYRKARQAKVRASGPVSPQVSPSATAEPPVPPHSNEKPGPPAEQQTPSDMDYLLSTKARAEKALKQKRNK